MQPSFCHTAGYKTETQGSWVFKLDSRQVNPDVHNQYLSCGHQQPNKCYVCRSFRQSPVQDIQLQDPETLQVVIEHPNIAKLYRTKHGEKHGPAEEGIDPSMSGRVLDDGVQQRIVGADAVVRVFRELRLRRKAAQAWRVQEFVSPNEAGVVHEPRDGSDGLL